MLTINPSQPSFSGSIHTEREHAPSKPVYSRGSGDNGPGSVSTDGGLKSWARNHLGGASNAASANHLNPLSAQNALLANNIQQLFEQMKPGGAGGPRSLDFRLNGQQAAIRGTSHHQLINAGNLQVEINNGKAHANSGVQGEMAMHAVLTAAQNALQQRAA